MARACPSLWALGLAAGLGFLAVGCAEPRLGIGVAMPPPGPVQASADEPPTPIRPARPAPCDQVLPGLELTVEGDAVRFGEAVAPRLVRVDHRDEAQVTASLLRVAPIHPSAPVPSPDQHRIDGILVRPGHAVNE